MLFLKSAGGEYEGNSRWRIDRAFSVPTATEGRRGVKRKKFFGETTIWWIGMQLACEHSTIEHVTYSVVIAGVKPFEEARCSPTAA
jgi:hypothetical protein